VPVAFKTAGGSRRGVRPCVKLRIAGFSAADLINYTAPSSYRLSSTNKCLAESNKSPDGPGATKKRRANEWVSTGLHPAVDWMRLRVGDRVRPPRRPGEAIHHGAFVKVKWEDTGWSQPRRRRRRRATLTRPEAECLRGAARGRHRRPRQPVRGARHPQGGEAGEEEPRALDRVRGEVDGQG
jgi:hypothetical protein